jgi:hypothetical protein
MPEFGFRVHRESAGDNHRFRVSRASYPAPRNAIHVPRNSHPATRFPTLVPAYPAPRTPKSDLAPRTPQRETQKSFPLSNNMLEFNGFWVRHFSAINARHAKPHGG